MLGFITGLPGGTEWIIILIIALLIFGKRLPDVMRSMGQSLKQFKKGMEDVDVGTEEESDEIDKSRSKGEKEDAGVEEREEGEDAGNAED